MQKIIIAAALFAALLPATARAHGDAGERSFPATLELEDPGIGDEGNFPEVTRFKQYDGGQYNWGTEAEAEWEKSLTKNMQVSISGALTEEDGRFGDDDTYGMSNIELGTKYNFYKNAAHEFMATVGGEVEIGDSGTKHSGAENFSTVTPTLYMGKGMGDLKAKYLKPFAVTTQVGYSLPTDRHTQDERNPDVLSYGATLQYSLPYLAETQLDVDMPHFISQLTPLVEVNMHTPFRGDDKFTTGTVQPGVLWQSDNGVQVGLEAILPMTSRTGQGVGAVAQLHLYFDDLLPDSAISKPIW